MNLELTETQTMFRDSLRKFLEAEVSYSRVRERETAQQTDEVLWGALNEYGWLGIAFPADIGGGDGGLVDAGLLVEEVQRRAALVPVAEVLMCALTIYRCGASASDGGQDPAESETGQGSDASDESGGAAAADAEQGSAARCQEIISDVLAGKATVVPSLLEEGDRFGVVAATVDRDGRLQGEKYFVDYAAFATHHLVAARRGGEIGLFIVDAANPGVSIEALSSVGRTPQSKVGYDGVAAEPICGIDGYEFLVKLGRSLAGVQALACMQKALEMTVEYTSVREQFGKPIGSFQAVQHHAADMATDIESTRFLVYEALDALERGEASAEQVAIAKAAASQAAPEVTMLAHQLHGGQGYVEEHDLYFYTLRAKERSLAWGTAEECLAVVAKTVDQPEEWL